MPILRESGNIVSSFKTRISVTTLKHYDNVNIICYKGDISGQTI